MFVARLWLGGVACFGRSVVTGASVRCAAHQARRQKGRAGRVVPVFIDDALDFGVDVLGHRLLDRLLEQLHKRLRGGARVSEMGRVEGGEDVWEGCVGRTPSKPSTSG